MRAVDVGRPQPAASGHESDLPYSRPYWDATEMSALAEVVATGMWTGGDRVPAFEQALERIVGTPVVCLSSGTTAIFALLSLLGEPVRGPKLLVSPTLNFAAGPAAAMSLGWDIALCDIDGDDLTMSATSLEELLTRVGRDYAKVVVLPMHYAGHSCDMPRISDVCQRAGAEMVEDACHAIGARYANDGAPVGSWPDSTAAYFSFHPTKPVATGEGGAVASGDPELLDRLRKLRNHGMVPMPSGGDDTPWPYDIPEPGLNLRLSDLHAAIGVVQAARAAESQAERARLVARYHDALGTLDAVRAVPANQRDGSAHHLFPVVFDMARLGMTKPEVVEFFLKHRVRCQVHYTPLHRLGAFRAVPAALRTSFDVAEAVLPGLLSLPLWRGMTDSDQDRVIEALTRLSQRAGGRI